MLGAGRDDKDMFHHIPYTLKHAADKFSAFLLAIIPSNPRALVSLAVFQGVDIVQQSESPKTDGNIIYPCDLRCKQESGDLPVQLTDCQMVLVFFFTMIIRHLESVALLRAISV